MRRVAARLVILSLFVLLGLSVVGWFVGMFSTIWGLGDWTSRLWITCTITVLICLLIFYALGGEEE